MQTISSLPVLLKMANVLELTLETLPKILQTMTDNKIRLNAQALDAMTSLLKSGPIAITTAYDNIQNSVQKANANNDKLSLDYIKELLNVFKSSGISDERISKLLSQIEEHEHEIRSKRTDGNYELAKIALFGVVAVAIAVITKKPPPKFPFWYK